MENINSLSKEITSLDHDIRAEVIISDLLQSGVLNDNEYEDMEYVRDRSGACRGDAVAFGLRGD